MKKGRAFLAFLAPLFLGAATSVALELSGLTLPPLYGSGIGLFVSFALVTPLVWTYETRGLRPAFIMCAFLLVQLVIACSATVAAVKLHWLTGVVLGVSLEVILAVTAAIRSKVGRDFALIGLAHAMIVMLGLAPFFVLVQRLSWAQAVAAAAGTAAVEMGVSGVGFLCGGIKIGLRGIYALVLLLLQVNLMWLEIDRLEMPADIVLGTGLAASVVLFASLTIGLYIDDGSGRMYGSGVEVFTFVMVAMALGYGVGVMMIAAFNSGPNTGHLAGAVLGGLFLLCPALCRLFGGKKFASASIRTGMKVSLLLQVVCALFGILLYFAGGLALNRSIQLGAYYAAGFVGFVVLVCLRFLVACLVCWLFCVGSVRDPAATTTTTSTSTSTTSTSTSDTTSRRPASSSPSSFT